MQTDHTSPKPEWNAYNQNKLFMHVYTICYIYEHWTALAAFSALTLFIGWQEGHPAHKNMGDNGGGHCLVRMEWCPARWSVCLPLLIFPCTIKSRSCLLAPAHPGGPRKRAVKRCGGVQNKWTHH